MRNILEATAGSCRTLAIASSSKLLLSLGRYVVRLLSNAGSWSFRECTTRDNLGGFPNRVDIGRSIGLGFSVISRSVSISLFSTFSPPSALPTTENRQRSRSAIDLKMFSPSGSTLMEVVELVCWSRNDKLSHKICAGSQTQFGRGNNVGATYART